MVLAATAAAQEMPPVCTAPDPLAELRRQDPSTFARVEAETAAVSNAKGVLWRIEKEDLAPSYLFGTIHLTDSRVTNLPLEVTKALSESATVALELAATGDPEAMAQLGDRMLAMAMNNTGHPPLASMTVAERNRIAGALQARGLPAEAVQIFKPWFLTVSLALPACEMARQRAAFQNVDELIATTARERGMPVVGLETDAEQLSILSSLEPWVYEAALRDSSRSEARNQELLELLVQLYLDRSPGALIPAYRHLALPEENVEAFMIFMKALMGSRNDVMRDRARPLLEKGQLFIAVGALHLPGKGGLVDLFRKEGYRLIRVL
ncbi:GumN family protein [Agaricicola taiwanensis]|uniref:GumN family protein n=2 Tax=Agaricicola taiwanensis TaxID=591372 RepID=A0A8J2VKU5_9RHOB|nr:GumN family protein [Agaricicola taiwanensis]